MRTLKFFSILLIMIPLVMTGCNDISTKTNVHIETQLQQLKSENNKIKDQLNSSLQSSQTHKNDQSMNKNVVDE